MTATCRPGWPRTAARRPCGREPGPWRGGLDRALSGNSLERHCTILSTASLAVHAADLLDPKRASACSRGRPGVLGRSYRLAGRDRRSRAAGLRLPCPTVLRGRPACTAAAPGAWCAPGLSCSHWCREMRAGLRGSLTAVGPPDPG